jgi:long-chain acyl-CoA synthetase
MSIELTDQDNAPAILFRQAELPERRDRPRMMVPREGGWTPVTWRECSTSVQRVASFLIDHGVGAGIKAAVLSATRLEWAIGGMAILAAQGTLVPVYPSLPPKQLAHILGHSDSQVLLVESAGLLRRVLQVWGQLASGGLPTVITFEPVDARALVREAGLDEAIADRVFSFAEVERRGGAALEREPRRVLQQTASIRLDDVAYLIYTSGTTGLPKGVPLSHRNVGSNGAAWVEVNGPLVEDGDIDVLWLPMSHIFGWGELCLGNQLGYLSYLSDPLSALKNLAAVRPQIFMSVPAYWEKLAQLAQAAATDEEGQIAALKQLTGGRLKFCLSGGAGLRREVKELFLRAGLLIVEGYGLTECSPTLTMNHYKDFNFATVGKPLSNVQLKLAADGEILAKGPNVFSGYYKDPEATRAIFDSEGWLHTGDIGRFTSDGFLQIVDRKKDILVTSGGKNVPPANIELMFKDDPLITYLVVYGDGKKYLTALVDVSDAVVSEMLRAAGCAVDGLPRRHPKVQEWIRARVDAVNPQLASFETIKDFRVADEPFTMENDLLTPSLKVKRARVYERYRGLLESMY